VPLIHFPRVNSRQFITSLYLVLLAGLGIGAGALFLEARADYDRLRQTEAASMRRLAEAKARLAQQEIILKRLRTDPDYVARVVRERLHYYKPGEQLFRFEN
jgi:cell division protein DivIC